MTEGVIITSKYLAHGTDLQQVTLFGYMCPHVVGVMRTETTVQFQRLNVVIL